MTVAVDTNVVLDIVTDDPAHAEDSLSRLRLALADGDVVVGEVAWAELTPTLTRYGGVGPALSALQISYQVSNEEALGLAGSAFFSYLRNRQPQTCRKCGTTIAGRARILPDFMIGAHAQVHAGRLLTRDRGYYAKYFPELVLV